MKSRSIRLITSKWAAVGLSLVAAGFLCDGITEVGHHALLILGSMAVGWGAATESK
jgi:hypothetical protein